jgi:hypothetical protein
VRILVVDFEFTVLWPLLIAAGIVLWNSIQAYRYPTPELESEERTAEWDQRWQDEIRKSRGMVWFSSALLLVVVAVLLTNDIWKANIADQAWHLLELASFFAFLISVGMVWHYASTVNRPRLILSVVLMLLTAASTEHLSHQATNSRHIVCPDCTHHDDN